MELNSQLEYVPQDVLAYTVLVCCNTQLYSTIHIVELLSQRLYHVYIA